jgi:predicted anti-sigma-YlaC factor YlaD
MTCRDVTDFLEAYVAADLADDVRIAFDGHLKVCPNCRRFLLQYEATVIAGKQAYTLVEETPIPDDLVKAILSALKKEDTTD